MKKVYFWEQIFLLKSLGDYETLLAGVTQKILAGDYASADIEKLQHRSKCLFSARINEKARMIFTSIKRDGQSCMLILDVLENHEYDQCKFLENHYIRDFFGRLGEEDIVKIPNPEALELDVQAEEAELSYQRVHYFQGQMIELSPTQADITQLHFRLPALIEGEAGSGKTCVGLCALSDYLNSHPEEDTKVLYIAPFPHLLEEMRAHWAGLNGDERAEFQIYDELFTTPPIATEELIRWLSRAPGFSAVDSLSLLKEFAMLMVVPSKKNYLALGERQSIFLTAEEKSSAWELFQAFKAHFNFTENYHPLFSALPRLAEYNLIYLDESQSFTPYQLFQILFLAKDYSMLAGFDRHQRLHGDRRNMQRFETLCHDRHIPLTNMTLNGSFRCPARVIQLINNILSVKYTLAQGRPDKKGILKYESKKPDMGQVHFYNESSDMAKIKAHLPENSTNWAVITSATLKAQASAIFRTKLVFTPEEILGLGYDFIVLYHLGQTPVVREMSRELKTLELQEFQHGARKELKEPYLSCLNQWIIAASRSHQGLLVVEPRSHTIRHFLNKLFRDDLLTPAQEPVATLTANTNWEPEILRLKQMGLDVQAEESYEYHLKKDTGMTFADWYESKTTEKKVTASGLMSSSGAAAAAAGSSETLTISAPRRKLDKKPAAEKKAAAAVAVAPPPPTAPITFSRSISAEMYKYAGLRLILDKIEGSISNAAFYQKHLFKHFNMGHSDYCEYITQPPERVPLMKRMIDKHAHVSMVLESGSGEPLFEPAEDYCQFLMYRISPESQPFITDFLDDTPLETLIAHMIEHPQHLSIDFLLFFVRDPSLIPRMIAQKSKLEKLICEATISYFDIVLDKDDAFIIENNKRFNIFFLEYIFLAIKLLHQHDSNELLTCLLNAPMIWRFLDTSQWADTPLYGGAQHNLLFALLFYPETMRFLEVMLVNHRVSPHLFIEKLIHSRMISRYLTHALSSEILVNFLNESCVRSEPLYQALKEKLIAKTIIDEFLQQPGAINKLLKLTEIFPNIWEGNFASPEVIIYQAPRKTQQNSLILKLMIDAQMSGIPGIQEKILQLFRAGTRPLYQEFNDTDWMLPMILDQAGHKFSWLMSPLFLMVKYPVYHTFFRQLLIEKPGLTSFVKWMNTSGVTGINTIRNLLELSVLGSEIWEHIDKAHDSTYQLEAIFLTDQLILRTNVESFFPSLHKSLPP